MSESKSRNFGIFAKLFIYFILAALIPLLVTWYFARSRAVLDANTLADLRLRSTANQLADEVETFLRINLQSMIEHASTDAMRSMRPQTQKGVLQTISQYQPWSYVVMVIAPSGASIVRSDDEPLLNYADRAYFKAAIAGAPFGQQVVLARSAKVKDKPAWLLAVPIRGPTGEPIGVLAKASLLTDLSEALVNQNIGRSGKAMLMAPDGKLIAITGEKIDKDLRDFSKNPAFVNHRSFDLVRYDDAGKSVIAWSKKTRLDWVVAVQMDAEEAFERVHETDAYMLRLLGIAAALALAFAAIVAPSIARPLRNLTDVTEEISRGNFDHELGEVERRDEIGALARSIQRMTRSLRIAMTRLGAA